MDSADQIVGSVLDVGCGTGDNALFFAGRGQPVVGIDFVEFPVLAARAKARKLGQNAEFLQMDAMKLAALGRMFDSVIDCGLFHVLSDEDRRLYVEGLALGRSSVVANCRMNRERTLAGSNKYSKELGFNPLELLAEAQTMAK